LPIFDCRFSIFHIGCILFYCSAPLRAQDVWTLTSADFSEQRVAVLSIDTDGVKVRDPAGQQRVIAWDSVLEIDRGLPRSTAPAGGLMLELIGGDRIAGEPRSLVDDTLTWSASWGTESVPLARVRAITITAPADTEAPAEQDAVRLRNGDVVRGVVRSIDRAGVEIAVGGEVTPLTWDSVADVQFAQLAAADTVPRRGFRVQLAGDTRLTVAQVSTSGDQLQLQDGSGIRRVPLASVVAIEQINGPVMWLSALKPVEAVYEPYFAQVQLPPRENRTLSGLPIKLGDKVARAGLSAAARTRWVYDLPPGYAAFRTMFSIDGNLPYANCVVRIKLDDRVAFERENVTASMPPQLVMLPLGGASKLAIEVDYGKSLDVQDRVNFFEPALLRQLPPARNPD